MLSNNSNLLELSKKIQAPKGKFHPPKIKTKYFSSGRRISQDGQQDLDRIAGRVARLGAQ